MKPHPTFLRFLRSCGFRPTRAQRVLIQGAFDAIPLAELRETDPHIVQHLFGGASAVPDEARRIVSITKGARIGGTYLSAMYMLFAALTVDLGNLAPGEQATALIVGPDLRLARQALRYVRGAVESLPEVAASITKDGEDGFTFTRPDGGVVRVECLPATRGGAAVRARSLVSAMMTEGAFFRDEHSGVVNDAEIRRAIVPRLMKGAKLIIESTPWLASGVLYENDRQFGEPRTCIPVRAPTLLMRPSAEMEAFVAEERTRDPQNARREFDAEFMDSGAGVVFDAQAVADAAATGLVVPCDPFDSRVGIGGDLGFASDSSAVVIVQWDASGRLCVVALEELRPTKGNPLVPSEVAETFARVAKPWRAKKLDGSDAIFLDLHYIESAKENFGKHSMRVRALPSGADGKYDQYQRVQELLHRGLVRLPNHPRLLGQMREVTARPLSGGGKRIESPRRAGHGHGDLVSALVGAVWALDHARVVTGGETKPPPLEFRESRFGNPPRAAAFLGTAQHTAEIEMPGLSAHLANGLRH